jgi:phosphoenolpyruvate carboxykinase (GTP)
VGTVPLAEELNLRGLTLAPEDLDELLSVDAARWRREMEGRTAHLAQFERLPHEITAAHERAVRGFGA